MLINNLSILPMLCPPYRTLFIPIAPLFDLSKTFIMARAATRQGLQQSVNLRVLAKKRSPQANPLYILLSTEYIPIPLKMFTPVSTSQKPLLIISLLSESKFFHVFNKIITNASWGRDLYHSPFFHLFNKVVYASKKIFFIKTLEIVTDSKTTETYSNVLISATDPFSPSLAEQGYAYYTDTQNQKWYALNPYDTWQQTTKDYIKPYNLLIESIKKESLPLSLLTPENPSVESIQPTMPPTPLLESLEQHLILLNALSLI